MSLSQMGITIKKSIKNKEKKYWNKWMKKNKKIIFLA
jgi:hypothetical protein